MILGPKNRFFPLNLDWIPQKFLRENDSEETLKLIFEKKERSIRNVFKY